VGGHGDRERVRAWRPTPDLIVLSSPITTI
jgi:hypothetical protein